MAWNVVIAGGGFGGAAAARELEKADAEAVGAAEPRQRRQLHALHAVPAGGGGGDAGAAARGDAAAGHPQADLSAARRDRRPRPRGEDGAAASHDGDDETLPYDQLLLALGSVSRTLPIPGSGRARDRLQGPRRRDLAAQPRDRDPGGSQRDRGPGPPRPAAHLRLRRRRLRRPRGAGRAAGLRRRRDGELPARPPARDALGAGRGRATGSCRRSTTSSPTTPCASCAAAASTSAWSTTLEEVSADSARLSSGETLPTTTVVWTAGVAPQPSLKQLNLPLDERGRVPVDDYLRVEGHRLGLGDRRLRRRARPARRHLPADRPARRPPGPGGGAQHRRRARHRLAASPSTTAAKPPSSTSAATRRSARSATAPSAASPPGGWPAATT